MCVRAEGVRPAGAHLDPPVGQAAVADTGEDSEVDVVEGSSLTTSTG